MSREESLKETLIKMRNAKSVQEYGQAIAEHFKKFNTPTLSGVPSHTNFDILNAPLLKKLGDLDSFTP
jgi:hypothetical protein